MRGYFKYSTKESQVELEIDPTLKAPKVNKYQWLIDLSERVDESPNFSTSFYFYLHISVI